MKVCKYCNKEIEGSHSVYANHVRWCDKNKTNGDKGGNKISEAKKKYYEDVNGSLKVYEVECFRCKKITTIEEPSNKYPIKEKYFCSRRCSNIRDFTVETKRKMSNRLIENWKNEEYANKIIKNNTNRNIRFTSKGEEEIKNYLKENHKLDNWTSGGGFKYKDKILTRDIYSNDLKIIVEYDGVWHFKDIHGQLEEKQIKDRLLEEWVIDNDWRIVRISDDLYRKEKEKYLEILIKSIYNKSDKVIKIY